MKHLIWKVREVDRRVTPLSRSGMGNKSRGISKMGAWGKWADFLFSAGASRSRRFGGRPGAGSSRDGLSAATRDRSQSAHRDILKAHPWPPNQATVARTLEEHEEPAKPRKETHSRHIGRKLLQFEVIFRRQNRPVEPEMGDVSLTVIFSHVASRFWVLTTVPPALQPEVERPLCHSVV
jgi:hypothetical protein